MPELPEVETITRQLNRKTKGLKIKKAWFDWPKLLKSKISQRKFKEIIKGKTILKVSRKGKNIIINLSDGWTCLIHLKLTGRILIGTEGFIAKDPYVHFKLELSDNKVLALSDLRKFAKIVLEKTEDINDLKEIKELGIEPLANNFTFQKFNEALLKKEKGVIKEILMNQNIIVGIGNIYASEILWEAKVSPFKQIKSLSLEEKKKIYKAIKKILLKAIRFKGSTIADKMYRDTKGEFGKYGKMLQAYHQEKCSRCKSQIKRVLQKGRSTFYCSQCQKE
jgi:formamidopyrimidine-DNA glycosylase